MNQRKLGRWRTAVLPFTLLATIAMVALPTTPAHASVGGDVINQLNSNYTVKVAMFGGSHTSSRCYTWNYNDQVYNYNTYYCDHWWLPSGKDSESLFGWFSDTDGVMVENSSYYVKLPNHTTWHWVPAGQWTKIQDNHNIRCWYRSDLGGPFCGV